MVAKNTSRISSSKIRSPIEAVNAVGLEPTVTLKEILHAVESSISAQPRLFPNGLTKIQLQLNFPGPVGVNLLLEGPPPISVETAEVLDWNALAEARPRDQRVAEAKRLLTAGAVYPRGCSEFVCAVLGIPYELANALMGIPKPVGSKPPYPKLEPGDIAGWINETGSGHVTIYIGESDTAMFIDVREPGAKPRSKNGFYDHELFESSRF